MKRYIIPQTACTEIVFHSVLMLSNNAGLHYKDDGIDPEFSF